MTEGSDHGLSSACDPRHPEDCSRCVIQNNQKVGTCECVGGGPRCGLCRQSLSASDSHDGLEYKGYFRLNDECQEVSISKRKRACIAYMESTIVFKFESLSL